MAKENGKRVRLMVPIASQLHEKLQELAKVDGRPLAYFAGMMAGVSCDKDGRNSFAKWFGRRITSGKKKHNYLGMCQIAEAEKERIQVLVTPDVIADLEQLANVMDCTIVKLVGLLLDHAVDAHAVWVKFFASPLGKPFIWFAGGLPSFEKPAEEFPEYKSLPWFDEDE